MTDDKQEKGLQAMAGKQTGSEKSSGIAIFVFYRGGSWQIFVNGKETWLADPKTARDFVFENMLAQQLDAGDTGPEASETDKDFSN